MLIQRIQYTRIEGRCTPDSRKLVESDIPQVTVAVLTKVPDRAAKPQLY